MTPNQPARKITPEDVPQFPCWLWDDNPASIDCDAFWFYAKNNDESGLPNQFITHWYPDQPTAPTCAPEDFQGGDVNAPANNRRADEFSIGSSGQDAPVIPSNPASRAAPAEQVPQWMFNVATELLPFWSAWPQHSPSYDFDKKQWIERVNEAAKKIHHHAPQPPAVGEVTDSKRVEKLESTIDFIFANYVVSDRNKYGHPGKRVRKLDVLDAASAAMRSEKGGGK